ncbi:MAG: metallophosphoesterase family protein [Pseudomonadota bacterium]
MRFAALADIHGNRSAFEAVLADMDALGVTEAVHLGDYFSGPLDAAGTAALLARRAYLSIRGNHDRWLVEQDRSEMGASDSVAYDNLNAQDLAWLASLPPTLEVFDRVLLCHGTPRNDQVYWLERVRPDGGVRPATLAEIEAEAEGIAARLILCAHTHIPRIVRLRDGRIILNPGSIGCPAYDDDKPVYHQMQTGTPNASYAILEKRGRDWSATFRSVPYRTDEMAALARKNGREDWARGLATGWFDG